MNDLGKRPADIVREARVDVLRISQAEFAEYLNKNRKIEDKRCTQSGVSKYENGKYKVPSDVLLVCQKITKRLKSEKEYAVNSIIGKLLALDPESNQKVLKNIERILLVEGRTYA